MALTLAKQTKNEPADVEAGYREALQDVLVVAKSLTPFCQSVDDLMGMVELALTNDAQLRILMAARSDE